MPRVKSAARALEVLELFERRRQAATTAEIATTLGYPKSSTLPLLKTMELGGFLFYDRPSGTFFPTLRVRKLGAWLKDRMFIDEATRLALETIHRETGETVTLTRASAAQSQVFQVLPGRQAISYTTGIGTEPLIPDSSVGLCILAQHSDARIETILHKLAKRRGVQARIPPVAKLMPLIKRTRKLGYAAAYNVNIPGVGGVAMALPRINAKSTEVVCVWGLTERIRKHERQLVNIMQQAVRDLR